MAVFIEMPKLSDTMTVGTIANWLKAEGETVESGDIIAEIETDKATMEVEAFEDGILLKQLAGVGDQVPIGGAIAAIGEEGEEVDASAAPKGDAAAAPIEEPKAEAPAAEAPATTAPAVATTPETPAPEPVAPATSTGRIKISPVARKIAAEKGLDISTLKGTGPNGRIVKADVIAAQPGTAPAASAPTAPAPTAPAFGSKISADETIPVTGMRNIIAQRLLESKTQVPHFYLETEVEVSALLKLRSELNAELAELTPEQGGIKFSVNDMILKASAEAIRRVPMMNRSWEGTTIKQSGSIHLAFGVDLGDGLVTPVIRDAESKSLKQVAQEAKTLIGKARGKKLGPAEMTGSTFTVTNLGMFGVTNFYGIINMPNAGILSVGATIARPIVNGGGEIVPGKVMSIGLSCDHRVVDGAVGAQFLQALKKILETPALILV
ncbi:MAG: dihydrolipoamide acetyltransferase family protein [Verrucomicrobiota bacterium]